MFYHKKENVPNISLTLTATRTQNPNSMRPFHIGRGLLSKCYLEPPLAKTRKLLLQKRRGASIVSRTVHHTRPCERLYPEEDSAKKPTMLLSSYHDASDTSGAPCYIWFNVVYGHPTSRQPSQPTAVNLGLRNEPP